MAKEFDVYAKFSSVPVAKAFEKSKNWKLLSVLRFQPKPTEKLLRHDRGMRQGVKTYSYFYSPKK